MGAATIILAHPEEISAIVADSPFASVDQLLSDVYSLFPGFTKYPFIWLTKLYTRIFLGFSIKDVAPSKVIGELKIPLLLIHSKQDSQIPFSHAQELYQASNKDTTTFWVIENGDHGTAHSQNKSSYEKRVTTFFKQNIQ